MDYVEQLQSLDETAGRQVIFDALNAAAMVALSDMKNESTQLDEARKVGEFQNGIHKATVHKDSDTGEYKVKFHTNGKHLKDADYFTDEKDDAIGTAKDEIIRMHSRDTE